MITKRIFVALSLLVFIAACGSSGDDTPIPVAQAAGVTSKDIGDHVVHFNAQSTDQLPPEVAAAYNIVRSKNRAMITVSIINKSDMHSISGEVSVKTVNLTGQLKNVTMRKVEEPGEPPAIYYIGITPVANRETLIFDISIKPEGVVKTSEVRFKQEFYTD